MKLLVTGGMGFIGSHTVVELLEKGDDVVIVDNLINSKIEVLDAIEEITHKRPTFYNVDLLDFVSLNQIFEKHNFDGVIHFAGLKAVNESIRLPLKYYENNIGGTINLLKCMEEHKVYRLVFSSSATVYGEADTCPIDETFPSNKVTNPYGRTKYFIEEILKDCHAANSNFRITILRYFNPVGAHSSGLIGEDPNDIPNNLMPYILRVAGGRSDMLHIYGNDYNTSDGTCIRDFIHVVDLAHGHIKALEHIDEEGVRIVNLGTGKGTTVLELVNMFNQVNGDIVKFDFAPRRAGDVEKNYASTDKAKKELGWIADKTIEDMCKDAWNFQKKHK